MSAQQQLLSFASKNLLHLKKRKTNIRKNTQRLQSNKISACLAKLDL